MYNEDAIDRAWSRLTAARLRHDKLLKNSNIPTDEVHQAYIERIEAYDAYRIAYSNEREEYIRRHPDEFPIHSDMP